MRIFGLLLILLVSLGCEDRLGETSVKSLSGKSYSKNNGLLFTTNLIKDFNTNGSTAPVDLGNHIVVNEGIFYTSNHPLFGDELFFWDRLTRESHMVEDLNFGGAGSNIRKLKHFGNYIYFFATTATEGTELRRVNIKKPYEIETFDVVSGLGMIPTISADDSALSATNYHVIDHRVVIYNHFTGIEVINLDTLELTTLSEDQGLPAVNITGFWGEMIRLNNNLYFVMTYSGVIKLFMIEDNLSTLVALSGGVYDRIGTSSPHIVKYKDSIFFSARADNNETHLFSHKGTASNPIRLFDPANLYGVISSIGGGVKFVSTNQYIYAYARKDAGTFAYLQYSIDTDDLSFSQDEITDLGDDSPSNMFSVGENYCVISLHETASEDLICYRAAQTDTYLVKTNFIDDVVGIADNPAFNKDWSNHITSNLLEINNNTMSFRDYTVNKNKLYFTARVDFDVDTNGGDFYGFELDLNILNLRVLGSATDTAFIQYDAVDTLVVADLSGQAGVVDLSDNELLGYPLSSQTSIGNGISSDSSNPKIIYDSENFILFTRDDQSLASTPYTNNFAGAIYVYDRINDTTYTLTHPDGGSIYFESINPGNGRKAMIKAFGNKVIIEASLNNSTGDYRRAPLIFNTTNGAYGLVHKFFGTSDYVDIGYFYDIFRVGSKFLIYCQDEDMGSPAFFEITTATEITSIANDPSNIRTFPIQSGDKLYFPYGVGNETVYAIKMNALGTGLEVVQVGPSGQVLPTGVVARAFATDDKFLYYNIEQSGDKLYFIEIENPLNHGFVLDSGNAQLIGQSFLKREGKLLSTDISLISKPLYQIDTSSGVPRANFIETIENEMFYNKGNDSVYKIGSEIKRITPQGEIVSLINEFSNYSDPTCSALAFTNGVDDDNFIYEFGVLALRGNGAAVDELCFFGTNGDAINFATFGYNLNGLKVKSIVDRGEKIFITITKPSYQTDLIVIDALDSSFEVIKTKSLNYGIQPFGYVYGDESIIYCDEDLSRVDMANNSYEIINEAIQCDPRALHRPLSQSGLWFSGIDRDNYVGYELYEVK